MTIEVECQFCGTSMRLRDEAAGRKFKCRGCQEQLQVPSKAGRRTRGRQKSERDGARPASRPDGNHPKRRKPRVKVESESFDYDFDESEYEDYDATPARRRPGQTPQKKKKRTSARKNNPQAFKKFDKVVNEVAIFYVGLALIIGGLGTAIFYMDKNPSDPERHRLMFQMMLVSAGVLFVMGMLSLSRLWIVLQIMRPLNLLLAVASVGAAIAGGFLVWILPIAFLLASGRIKKAVSSYPKI